MVDITTLLTICFLNGNFKISKRAIFPSNRLLIMGLRSFIIRVTCLLSVTDDAGRQGFTDQDVRFKEKKPKDVARSMAFKGRGKGTERVAKAPSFSLFVITQVIFIYCTIFFLLQ